MGGGKASAGAMLSPMEAAPVQAILRNALEKLSLASVITVDVDEQAAELSRSVGDEISRAIREQRQLEQRFEVLISQRGNLNKKDESFRIFWLPLVAHNLKARLRPDASRLGDDEAMRPCAPLILTSMRNRYPKGNAEQDQVQGESKGAARGGQSAPSIDETLVQEPEG
jgi:hypothetical protein